MVNKLIRHPVKRSCHSGAEGALPLLLLLILLQTRTQDRLKKIFHARTLVCSMRNTLLAKDRNKRLETGIGLATNRMTGGTR
jgi:hypothetical protein